MIKKAPWPLKETFPFLFFVQVKYLDGHCSKQICTLCWNLWFLPSTCSVCREAFGLNSLEFLSLILFHPLLPVLSPFWQHVLSPPIVKSSKRIKHFIPQHQTFYPESLARLKSKPRRNRKKNSGKKKYRKSGKSVKYWEMWFHDPSFGSITDISWFWGRDEAISSNLWQVSHVSAFQR